MAEPAEDATNGLFSTLSGSDICTAASPGKAFQPCPYGSGVWDGEGSPSMRSGLRSLPREGG